MSLGMNIAISSIPFLLCLQLATGFLVRTSRRHAITDIPQWTSLNRRRVMADWVGWRQPTKRALFPFLLSNTSVIPKTVNDRNRQMADSVKAAIASPRAPSCKLIECEFPALSSLNKLGDGSLRSAMQADDANIEASLVIARSFLPAPFGPGKVWMVPSRSSSERMKSSLKKQWNSVHLLSEGMPPVKSRDVCIFVSPSSSADYDAATRLTTNGNVVVVVNGQAKTPQSIPEGATMAYYLKPLTNNSQVAGFLIRRFPHKWIVLDAASTTTTKAQQRRLGEFTDEEILVPKTNTPDLRPSVRLVQQNS